MKSRKESELHCKMNLTASASLGEENKIMVQHKHFSTFLGEKYSEY